MKAILLSIAVIFAAACGRGDREVRLQRLEVQRRGLVEQLERLQARLLVDRERVSFWTETRERRKSVTAIARGQEEEVDAAAGAHILPPPTSRRPPGADSARLASLNRPGTSASKVP